MKTNSNKLNTLRMYVCFDNLYNIKVINTMDLLSKQKASRSNVNVSNARISLNNIVHRPGFKYLLYYNISFSLKMVLLLRPYAN